MSISRRALGGSLLALTLALSACGSAGESDETVRDENGNIVEGGEVGVFKMNVGDCFSDPAVGEIESLQAVPCAESHAIEVFATFDMPDGNWPGDLTIENTANDGCYDRFPAYVGIDYESSVFAFSYLSPTEDGWNMIDDREIVCVLTRIDDAANVGTAKNSGI